MYGCRGVPRYRQYLLEALFTTRYQVPGTALEISSVNLSPVTRIISDVRCQIYEAGEVQLATPSRSHDMYHTQLMYHDIFLRFHVLHVVGGYFSDDRFYRYLSRWEPDGIFFLAAL